VFVFVFGGWWGLWFFGGEVWVLSVWLVCVLFAARVANMWV
jgi:hypothetical protein